MALHPQAFYAVPEETARVAHAAYPKGNVYMHVRDELGMLYHDEDFAHVFAQCGQPAEAPWRLLLVSIMLVQGLHHVPSSLKDFFSSVFSKEAITDNTTPLTSSLLYANRLLSV